jgi:hypothetical protein
LTDYLFSFSADKGTKKNEQMRECENEQMEECANKDNEQMEECGNVRMNNRHSCASAVATKG